MNDNSNLRLAIVCTHPIQYYAPVFAQLSQRSSLKVHVFYGWRGATEKALDPGFGQEIAWDIPLLEGYEFEFVSNVANDPGPHSFRGIDLPELPQAIERWKPDAILIYGWCYKAHLRAMRYFHGKIPVLFRGDSTLLNEKPGWRKVARRCWLRWVYQHVDIALVVGSHNRRYFEAHGLENNQLVFAPHAIDNSRFSKIADAKKSGESIASDTIRKNLGVTKEQVLILFVGKFEPIKAPEILIEAFKRVPDTNAHLVMIGSGVLQSILMQRAGERTHFPGFINQKELPNWYCAADVVVLPSRSETWGLVLNEAMACGRAIIASDRVGATEDLIKPGTNGWVCKAGDLDDLTDRLKEAISAGTTRLNDLGSHSKKIIDNWSIERQADAIAKAVVNAVRSCK